MAQPIPLPVPAVPLLSPARVARTLDRLACEAVERLPDASALVVLGIPSRGDALAADLARRIAALVGHDVPTFALDVSAFRDDRQPASEERPPPNLDMDLTGCDVLLVDDVLHTGRTVRAALDAVVQRGRPRSIRLAVLVDRGGREYPIQPDAVGRVVAVDGGARVVVRDDFSVEVHP